MPLRNLSTAASLADLREYHTMPVARDAWNAHASALREAILDFYQVLSRGAQVSTDFHDTADWVAVLVGGRARIHSLTLALQPFEYFDTDQAASMLRVVDADLALTAQSIETSARPPSSPNGSEAADAEWLSPTVGETIPDVDAVGRAFLLQSRDLYDIHGEFSPALVLAHYYLDIGRLIGHMVGHLQSLGIPSSNDPLIAICVVGWISSARDQIAAYCAMDALLGLLSRNAGAPVVTSVLAYLRQREVVQRQNRHRISIAVQRMTATDDPQSFAFDLAEVYKRLVEGPVKQFGWVMHCLNVGTWTKPLRLDNIRDSLINDGDWTAAVARSTILTNIRNGEAHEDLHWDGHHGCYVVDGDDVARDDVARAAMLSDSFARGCDAAIAVFEGIGVVPSKDAARPTDIGRVSAWQRAAAHFGSNGLVLRDARFNSTVAEVHIEKLTINGVDPCFQAIATCRGLLPHVERYEIYVMGSAEPVISVTAEALDRTLPVRDQAREWFTLMPRSTFLPAYLDARGVAEDPSTACRSIAWLAATDLLDAIDDSPALWPPEQLELTTRRMNLIGLSMDQCIAAASRQSRARLLAVQSAACDIVAWLHDSRGPISRDEVHRLEAVGRARMWLTRWGPVDILPAIVFAVGDDGRFQHSGLADPNPDLTWRTM
jgi:hypothetical protein